MHISKPWTLAQTMLGVNPTNGRWGSVQEAFFLKISIPIKLILVQKCLVS